MQEWLQSLKAGDEVAISGNAWNAPTILKVERVLKTQIVTTHGMRWNRNYGTSIGDRYSIQRLQPVTESVKRAILRASLDLWMHNLAGLLHDRNTSLPLEMVERWRKELEDYELNA